MKAQIVLPLVILRTMKAKRDRLTKKKKVAHSSIRPGTSLFPGEEGRNWKKI